ncbi:MAG: aspartate dehydrogenase [Alphaproteobacteria bacterium]|nr:aspartate dehydrogenase [Alphaproteobacteria bacterium]
MLKVAIGGLGAIGRKVAEALDRGLPGLRLAAVSARDSAAAAARLSGFRQPVPVVGLGELAAHADIVVESVPAAAFAAIADPAVAAGRLLIVLSAGQLLERMDLVERARETGARILVPTGALLGLDAVRAAALDGIASVRMVTRKPPAGLKGAPHIERNAIRLDGLQAPLCVFQGNALEAARGFPANVNVAAALSLAGIGPERTEVEVWADPTVSRNTHRIVVDAAAARLEMQIENVPSAENPRTGRITAYSVLAALSGLTATLKVGT